MPSYNKLHGHGGSARLSYPDTAGQVNEAHETQYFLGYALPPTGRPRQVTRQAVMSTIPDFTESELSVVRAALQERYPIPPKLEFAESEMRLEAEDRELSICPTLYWQARRCHFVICKTGSERYRNQFFYSVREQYGTGITEYSDLGECVLTLLRLQADHESQRDAAK